MSVSLLLLNLPPLLCPLRVCFTLNFWLNAVRLYTDYCMLKQAILGLFRILRKNKNPLICRRDLMWAVREYRTTLSMVSLPLM